MLAFLPVIASSLAFAETKDEYSLRVAEAKAKVVAAQESLQKAIQGYNTAIANGQQIDADIATAQQNVQNAQKAYDQSLIPDPTWIRPTKEITVSEQVPYTVQVPHTELVTTTELVPREVTTIIPSGLTAKSYNMLGYNNRPPLPTEDRLVATQIVENINFQWGGGMILNSGLYEDVIVNFTGNIYTPETGTYTFYAPGDDGVQVLIDGNRIINDWYDKGGGGSTVTVNLTQGIHSFTLWFYENGGGANVWLYWATPNSGLTLVPPSAFGQQTKTEIVYDEVTTTTEVTTFTEETQFRTETHTEIVPDEDAIQQQIKDTSLLSLILSAQVILDNLTNRRNENSGIIESASNDVTIKTQELNVAQQELEAIPPFREPAPTPTQTKSPAPEPTQNVVDKTPATDTTTTPKTTTELVATISEITTVDPKTLTDAQVSQLVEAANAIFETATQGSPEYNQALEALSVAAKADDPELPAALEGIPGAVAVLETFNNLGNIGADISPQVREQAKKTVIASVIAAGAAVQAVATTTSAASSGGGASRRNK